MKIVVLNGSPKGKKSVTMQSVHYIEKKFPQHEMNILNISERIRKIETDKETFEHIIKEIETADGVLWAFPLYVFLVPYQYKRFIELIWENGSEEVFKQKYTAALSTSIHFFDHLAHTYIHGICDDLSMKFTGSFSADMYDLLKEDERGRLHLFADNFFQAIEEKAPGSKSYLPIDFKEFDYQPVEVGEKIRLNNNKVVVLTDSQNNQNNLIKMIERFKVSFHDKVEVINLCDINIKGGCLGCLQCAYDDTCTYHDKDEFIEFYRKRLMTADILIFAGEIRDRYLSSRWKLFFDRAWFNGHKPSFSGKQLGFIISGPFSQIPNLRQFFNGYAAWQQANLLDIISDECGNSAEINSSLQSLAKRSVRYAKKGYRQPGTFLSVGGLKIFRDDVWGRHRFIFQSDHNYFKKHGIYDFPQKDIGTRITSAMIMWLSKIPAFRRILYTKMMKPKMIEPHQKVLDTL